MTPDAVTTDLSMLEQLVRPAGKEVLDVGCGGGWLVRELASLGARVVGVEVSERQLSSAVARDSDGAARYLVGSAQALPLEDASVDVAIFMRTLHHVPSPDLMRALDEACRVVRPGGHVYVAEPLARGDYHALTSIVEDERDARQAAQNALGAAARAGLERVLTVDYDVRVTLADLAAFRARTVSVDPDRAKVFDAREADLAAAFERLGEPAVHPGERCFTVPMRADLLRAGLG
jgi:2-polyprenyl-3-methyl-5-hydroxy-6-metoxy-1,4-benzoquinol methylase